MPESIRRVSNTELKTGMRIIIPAGDTLSIDGEVRPSLISPGAIVAETNIGPIYFAADLTTKVLGSDESVAEPELTKAASL